MFEFFYKIVWRFIRSILFLFPPEFSHKYTFKFIKFFFKIPLTKSIEKSKYVIKKNNLERNLFGLKFTNPVGLAAGFDKNAELINEIDAFGFSFIEIGTVTPEPQFGNEKPRVFRLKNDEALINRLGFNNEGLEKIIKRLKNKKTNIIIGGNIGKNKNTPIEDSVQDYKKSFNQLFN